MQVQGAGVVIPVLGPGESRSLQSPRLWAGSLSPSFLPGPPVAQRKLRHLKVELLVQGHLLGHPRVVSWTLGSQLPGMASVVHSSHLTCLTRHYGYGRPSAPLSSGCPAVSAFRLVRREVHPLGVGVTLGPMTQAWGLRGRATHHSVWMTFQSRWAQGAFSFSFERETVRGFTFLLGSCSRQKQLGDTCEVLSGQVKQRA